MGIDYEIREFFKMHFKLVQQWVKITSLYLEGRAEI